WVVELMTRTPTLVEELEVPAAVAPWPDEEIWSFQANPRLRIAALEGAVSVDAARSGVPAGWRGLPSYAVAAEQVLNLVERSRNDAEDENRLSLVRDLWLDFDGDGYTALDRVTGEMRSGWRLDMAAPYLMTSADADGEEGETFIGSDDYLVGEAQSPKAVNLGNAASLGVMPGDNIVSTATDDEGNTSEFSQPATTVVGPACVLDLELSYTGSILTMDWNLGTTEPAVWGMWMFIPGTGVFPLWSIPLPPIDPPASFPISIPGFPSMGTIGFLTALITSEGVTFFDFGTVDTGSPSSAVPSGEELRELFRGANKILSDN
ncbi:MAG: hypothetical protein IH863_01985, partial [Chloroflexi bacterium]|nr:hypothetical protein [Chloroflexota bacterium]